MTQSPRPYLGYIFVAIGVVLLIIGGLVTWHTVEFKSKAESAEGTVIEMQPRHSDGSTTYAPVVEFETAGGELVTYHSSSSSSPPAYDVGESVEVLYDPNDPSEAKINSFFNLWFLPLLLAGMGIVFGGIGGLVVVVMIRGTRRQEEEQAKQREAAAHLVSHGRRVETSLQQVARNTSYSRNGRNPYRIITEWHNPATSKMHIFESEDIWFDPEPHMQDGPVMVLVDRDDPTNYELDLSFLPELA